MSDDFDLSTATPDFDLSSAKPIGVVQQKSPMEMLEAIQPTVPPSAQEPRKPVVGTAEALAALSTGMPASLAGNVAGVGARAMGASMPEAEKKAQDVAASMTFAPRTQTGQEYAEGVSNVLSSLPPVLGEGFGAGTVSGKNLAGMASEKMAPVANAVASKFLPSAEILKLARKARDLGIPLRLDMLYDNKIAKFIGEAMEQIPLSGSKKEARQIAFNRAIIKQIGGDTKEEKLTPGTFDDAISNSGKTIGDIAEKTKIPVNQKMYQSLAGVLEESDKYATPDVHKIVENHIKDLASNSENGVIPGKAFREWNSKITAQLRRTTNGDLKHHLGELQEAVMDEFGNHLSKEDAASYAEARKQYAIAKTLEPIVAKSPEGNISPSALMGRVTSDSAGKSRMARGRGGDFGDLARIGQRFLKEPPSSGTADRALAYSLMGGGGTTAAVTGTLPYAAGVYGTSALYNLLGPRMAKAVMKERGQAPVAGPLSRLSPAAVSAAPVLLPRSSTGPLSHDDLQWLQARELATQ